MMHFVFASVVSARKDGEKRKKESNENWDRITEQRREKRKQIRKEIKKWFREKELGGGKKLERMNSDEKGERRFGEERKRFGEDLKSRLIHMFY